MMAARFGAAVLLVAAVGCGSPQKKSSAASEPPPANAVGAQEEPQEPEGLTQDDLRMGAIAKAVNDTTADWHECWAIGAADDFRLAGRVVVEVAFDDEGKATRASVVEDETGDDLLKSCLVKIYESYDWPPVFDASASARFPFVFQAPEAQYTIRGEHIRATEMASGKLSAKVLVDARNTGNAAIGLSRLVLRGGIDVKPHTHTAAELLYVVSGTGVAYDQRGRKRGVAVGPNDVIYAPAGSAHGFLQTGAEDTVVLSLYTPGGAEQRFKGGQDPGTVPFEGRAKRGMPKTRVRKVEADGPYEIAGGHGKVYIGFDARSAKDDAAYVGRIQLDRGLKIPYHQHEKETEVLYLLEGEGTLTVNGTGYPVAAGDSVQVPPGVMHSFEVSGKGPVTAVQFYSPSGPEQRFKASE